MIDIYFQGDIYGGISKKKLRSFYVFSRHLTFWGCTSVPYAKGYPEDEGKYRVTIDRDYRETPKEFQYAVNSFVLQQGGKSYNIEKDENFNDFIITIPGDTLVIEDLPELKHFHKGRTMGLIFGIVGPLTLIGAIIGFMFLLPRSGYEEAL